MDRQVMPPTSLLVFGVHQDQGVDVANQEGGGGHYLAVHSTPLTRECRRGREPVHRRAHATMTSWWSGMGNLEEECPQEWGHGSLKGYATGAKSGHYASNLRSRRISSSDAPSGEMS